MATQDSSVKGSLLVDRCTVEVMSWIVPQQETELLQHDRHVLRQRRSFQKFQPIPL